MKTVYFVRHGETLGNTGKVFQDNATPLTELGHVQANKVAERCSRLDAEALLVSSTRRTCDTAKYIEQATGLLSEILDIFVERKRPDAIRGLPTTDIAASKIEKDWNDSFFTDGRKVLDGESFEELLARVDTALLLLAERQEDRILVVTHGFFLHTIAARLLFDANLSPSNFGQFFHRFVMANTGITMLTYDVKRKYGPWRINVWNDHAHLG